MYCSGWVMLWPQVPTIIFSRCLLLGIVILEQPKVRAADMFCELTGPCASEGPHHKLHKTVDGSVFGIGRNNFGQLGDGSNQYATEPVVVQTVTPVSYVSAGGWHTVFLRTDGTAMSVGRNDAGQLADGTWISQPFPRRIITDAKAVSAGYSHSLILLNNGTAYAAGSNEHGQLGIGDYFNRNVPVAVLHNVSAISAGECHSLFVRIDGSVWGAGCNQFGQLGDGTTLGRRTPSQSPTLSAVTAVYGGAHKSLFVRNDDSVWAAGQKDDRLGHNPGPDWPRSTPVQIATNTIRSISADQATVLGNTVFATDNRFPPSDPLYAQGLPNLVGLGWNGWNYR